MPVFDTEENIFKKIFEIRSSLLGVDTKTEIFHFMVLPRKTERQFYFRVKFTTANNRVKNHYISVALHCLN